LSATTPYQMKNVELRVQIALALSEPLPRKPAIVVQAGTVTGSKWRAALVLPQARWVLETRLR
jgi:hypothetical protein